MRRSLLAALLTYLLGGAWAQPGPFPDVPRAHWAAEAVAELAALGILEGFPDGTFRGDEELTRYEAALLFARLLLALGIEEAEVAAQVGEFLIEADMRMEEIVDTLDEAGGGPGHE